MQSPRVPNRRRRTPSSTRFGRQERALVHPRQVTISQWSRRQMTSTKPGEVTTRMRQSSLRRQLFRRARPHPSNQRRNRTNPQNLQTRFNHLSLRVSQRRVSHPLGPVPHQPNQHQLCRIRRSRVRQAVWRRTGRTQTVHCESACQRLPDHPVFLRR